MENVPTHNYEAFKCGSVSEIDVAAGYHTHHTELCLYDFVSVIFLPHMEHIPVENKHCQFEMISEFGTREFLKFIEWPINSYCERNLEGIFG